MTLKIATTLMVFALAVVPGLAQTAPSQNAAGSGSAATLGGGWGATSGATEATAPPAAAPLYPVEDIAPTPPEYSLPAYVPAWTERWWFQSDYLMGFVRPAHLPALVTTSPAGTAQAQAGVLGASGTSVLFGDRDVNGDMRSGFREQVGCWFDNDRTLGVSVGFFWLTGVDQQFSASSNGSTILARPFTDAVSGSQSSLLVAYPSGSGPAGTSATGAVAIAAGGGAFYGGNLDFEESLINDPNLRLKSLLGFRSLRLADSVNITQTTNPIGGAPTGTQILSQDGFLAGNTFWGGEVGFQAQWIRGPFAADLLCKCAVGGLQREVNINGSTSITAPGNSSFTQGGLLALPTNIGTYSSNTFTVVPELGLTLSWNVTANLRLTAGYSVLVLFNAVRAADQIDTTVNSSLLSSSLTTVVNSGTALRPAFTLQQSDVWVQTLNLGLEFRY